MKIYRNKKIYIKFILFHIISKFYLDIKLIKI